MDTKQLFSQPIVVAKPLRGREMQSTAINKDIMNTIRAVSAKQVEGDIALQSLKKPKEGDVEIYHEGYIDGKLYLVPDSNLQAMRDIINLKMRRRHSSTSKPQTSLDEPSTYSEFSSKLNCLLEKIDMLAESSEEEGSLGRGTTKRSKSSDKKKKSDESKDLVVPPIMDETIKYKRVKPKEPSKQEKYTQDLKIEPDQEVDEEYKVSQLPEELTTQIFRALISGHLQNGYNPIFIVHRNYIGPNILQNQTPDFKTHKKEGNVDIYISGKFFTENILLEESLESPAMLNVDPQRIIIDKNNDVYKKKFKEAFSVDSVDIVFEGEFKMDKATSKYTPVFSLEILKNASLKENVNSESAFQTSGATTVLYGKQNMSTPFNENQEKSPRSKSVSSKQKHVHYKTGEKKVLHSKKEPETNNKFKSKGILDKIGQNSFYKKLFNNKNKGISKNVGDLDKGSVTSSQIKRPRLSKQRREELVQSRRSRKRERKAGRENVRKGGVQAKRGSDIFSIKSNSIEVSKEKDSPTNRKSNLSKESIAKESSVANKVIKVKRKKLDKNQEIVGNPILAQMQEFFLG